MIQTGYFANEQKFTKVHIVNNGKPICGSVIKGKSFMFCANGIISRWVECVKCKKKLKIN